MTRRTYTDDEIITALESHPSAAAAARALGLNERTLRRRRDRLALKGYSPEHGMTHAVPDGFNVKGVSTYYDEDGRVRGQWVKSSADADRREAMMREAVAAMSESIRREKPRPAPKRTEAALLNCYVVTDYHLGQLAWGEETREADWDTDIAEGMLVDWFSAAIAQSPAAETAVFAQLGDFLHWDGMDAVTPQSRHLLDADTRFQKLVRVAIRVVRRVIGMLLAKHQRVHVLMAEGNHDMASSIWLRELLAELYADEPRVAVDVSPDPYYCVEHGNTALFFHHGHKRGVKNIDTVFAAKFREVFGRTRYAYAHMGHLHHVEVKETNLMLIEQHQTLAAKDAYASRGGWMSDRSAQVITYHDKLGEVGRVRVSAALFEEAA